MTCRCSKCGYEWQAKIEKPKSCPTCKSYTWNERLKKGGKK